MTVFAPRAISRLLYHLGQAMVESDKGDIGKWGGGHTFIHHYQCGAILMFLGGIGEHIDNAKKQVLSGTRPYRRS